MFESWVAIEEFIFEVLDIDEENFAFLCVDLHRLHSSMLFEDYLFYTYDLRVVNIWKDNLLSISSPEFIDDS